MTYENVKNICNSEILFTTIYYLLHLSLVSSPVEILFVQGFDITPRRLLFLRRPLSSTSAFRFFNRFEFSTAAAPIFLEDMVTPSKRPKKLQIVNENLDLLKKICLATN